MRFPIRLPAHHSRAQGVLCVLYSVLIWSGWIILSSYSVRGTLTAYDITALRFGTAGLLLMPVLIKRGFSIGPWGWKGSFMLALLMGATYNIIAIIGMKHAPASHAAGIINTTMLTVTTLGSLYLLKEKTTALRLMGIVLSLAGIICMLVVKSSEPGADTLYGHLCFIIGGIIWAFYVLLTKAWKADPLHAASAVCGISFIVYMPIYLLFLPSHIGMDNWHEALFQGVYQGIFNGIFALLLFTRAVVILGASAASAFLPLVPLIATVAAIPLLGEMPNALEWSGIALAASGILLSTGIIGKRSKCTAPDDGFDAGN